MIYCKCCLWSVLGLTVLILYQANAFASHSSLFGWRSIVRNAIPRYSCRYSSLLASSQSGAAAARYGEALFTQVISDVDDTLKSSGGVNIAGVTLGGIDVQYARGEFYPGVAEFMLQVSIGVTTTASRGYDFPLSKNDQISSGAERSESRKLSPPKVAILTARAEEFKLALQLKEDSSLAVAFRKAGEDMGIRGWGLGPVLYGSVAEWIVQDRKGLRKFTNFERLLQQDPTGGRIFNYVYVGDTGELDYEAGETMLREYPTFVKAVFLHCVSSVPGGNVRVPPPKLINGRPIVFFRTYVGAAVAATRLELMSPAGLARVVDAACKHLENVPRSSDKWTDLINDIESASAVLQRF
ncbi:hypothetical protein ACA910_017985 [Epithemia clementina (nom. ined.)]